MATFPAGKFYVHTFGFLHSIIEETEYHIGENNISMLKYCLASMLAIRYTIAWRVQSIKDISLLQQEALLDPAERCWAKAMTHHQTHNIPFPTIEELMRIISGYAKASMKRPQ